MYVQDMLTMSLSLVPIHVSQFFVINFHRIPKIPTSNKHYSEVHIFIKAVFKPTALGNQWLQIFVRPDHYAPALEAIRLYNIALYNDHVLVDLELESVVMQIVKRVITLASRKCKHSGCHYNKA